MKKWSGTGLSVGREKDRHSSGDGRRIARAEQEIKKTIAQYMIAGFRHPLPGLITIVNVVMPGDLRTAKVYVSVLGDEKQRDGTIEIMQSRAFEVQEYIGKQLRMRFCPKLTFYADDTTEHVMKIDRILHELEQERAVHQYSQGLDSAAKGSVDEASDQNKAESGDNNE